MPTQPAVSSSTTVLDISYDFSASYNNGKIESQTNELSGEEVEYQYDMLNRLSLAETDTGYSGDQWGQSYAYDGFGNLTTVSQTKGTGAYTTMTNLSVAYSASTNRRTTDCADANGNLDPYGSPCNGTYTYDKANRIAFLGGTVIPTTAYSYGPGNRRVWRGQWDGSGYVSKDELTYYSAGGAKLVVYDLSVSGSNLRAAKSGEYYEYFGGKLLKNSGAWVNAGAGKRKALVPQLIY